MSKYIDAEELKSAIRKAFPNLMMRVDINSIINEQPTADVVPSRYGCGSAPYCSYVFEVDEDE